MKSLLNYILVVILTATTLTFTSCSSNDETTTADELAGLTKFKEFSNDTHTIEMSMSVRPFHHLLKIAKIHL